MDELTREFLIESQEGLDRMERCLTDLEERPDDAALLADIFRSVHTSREPPASSASNALKSSPIRRKPAGYAARRQARRKRNPSLPVAFHLLDGLRSILKTIESDDQEGDGSDAALIENLDQLQSPTKVEEMKQAAHARGSSAKAHVEPRPAVPAEPPVATVVQEPAAVVETRQAPPAAPTSPAPPEAREAETTRAKVASGTSAAESTLRVDVSLLNRMMNLVANWF